MIQLYAMALHIEREEEKIETDMQMSKLEEKNEEDAVEWKKRRKPSAENEKEVRAFQVLLNAYTHTHAHNAKYTG